MRKRVIAALMAGVMATALLVGCGGGSSASSSGGDAAAQDTQQAASSGGGSNVINLWSFTEEVPGMVEKYIETHPDFGYTVNTTVIATTEGAYQPALDQALQAGGAEQPDMYCAEAAFVLKYTKGDMSSYAMPLT